MTQAQSEQRAPDDVGANAAAAARAMRFDDEHHRRDAAGRMRRWPTVVVLVVALLTASLTRVWAVRLQADAARTGPYAGGTGGDGQGAVSVGSLDSFFLALLLGGLRGPLVMFLWATVESQKNDRDLEDVDTMIEMIRLLQPEFDSVHIFMSWNKAYNISAQLASLPRKYAVIIDAVEYARRVDAARPNNINIQMILQQLYSHKLGSSANDKNFYIRQVRADTKWRPGPTAPPRAGVPRQRLDPMLDQQGNLLPELIAPRRTRPNNLEARVLVLQPHVEGFAKAAAANGVALRPQMIVAAPSGDQVVTLGEPDARKMEAAFKPLGGVAYAFSEWNDGSELQYLAPYQPFPGGLSPMALGYNYAKKAQVLLTVGKQKPGQLSAPVVDRQPATELMQWSEEEWTRARAMEMAAFDRAVPKERPDQEMATADVPMGAPVALPQHLPAALHGYQLTARLARDARAEFDRHLGTAEHFASRFAEFGSNVDTLNATEQTALGDHDYLLALTTPPGPARDALLRSAATHYDAAVSRHRALNLRYFVPVELLNGVMPPGKTRLDLSQISAEDPKLLDEIYAKTMALLAAAGGEDLNAVERAESQPYQDRGLARLALIDRALGGPEKSGLRPRALAPAPVPTTGPVGPAAPAP